MLPIMEDVVRYATTLVDLSNVNVGQGTRQDKMVYSVMVYKY